MVRELPGLAERLRSRGGKVSTSDLVVATRILDSYASLTGRSSVGEDELYFVLSGVFTGVPEAILLEELRSMRGSLRSRADRIVEDIEERLRVMGVKPGQLVSKPMLRGKGRERREKLAAYLDLRRAGVIRRGGRGERVLGWDSIWEVALGLARRGYASLREVGEARVGGREEALMEAESGRDFREEALRSLDPDSLLDLGMAAIKKGNRRMLMKVAGEVSRRIVMRERLDPDLAIRVLRVAGEMNYDYKRLLALVSKDPGLIRELDRASMEWVFTELEPEEAASLASKALKQAKDREEAEKILSAVDPRLLWMAKKAPLEGRQAELLKAAREASMSLREALAYYETGNPGRLDMAQDYAVKARRSVAAVPEGVAIGSLNHDRVMDVLESAEALIELAQSGGGALAGFLKRLYRADFYSAVRVLRSAYQKSTPEMREFLERAMERLLNRFSSREGLRLLPESERRPVRPGRLDVKPSVMNLVRMAQDPLVYKRRLRSARVSLALDVSGSMAENSVWALGVSALFLRNIDKLTVFSHRIQAFKGPLTKLELAEILLTVEFGGYTDIYSALIEASESPSRRVIMVTDLKQTVNSGDPLEAVMSIRSSGRRITFIIPVNHDYELRRRIEESGSRCVIAASPREAARGVLRSLMR